MYGKFYNICGNKPSFHMCRLWKFINIALVGCKHFLIVKKDMVGSGGYLWRAGAM